MRTNILTLAGAPGSGKTAALRVLIDNAVTLGGRVVIVDPLENLVAAYGARKDVTLVDLTDGREVASAGADKWRASSNGLLVITGIAGDRAGELIATVVHATDPIAPGTTLWLVVDDVTSLARDARAALVTLADTLPPCGTMVFAGSVEAPLVAE